MRESVEARDGRLGARDFCCISCCAVDSVVVFLREPSK